MTQTPSSLQAGMGLSTQPITFIIIFAGHCPEGAMLLATWLEGTRSGRAALAAATTALVVVEEAEEAEDAAEEDPAEAPAAASAACALPLCISAA